MTKPASTAELILHRPLSTTPARPHPTATAVAIQDGRFLAVGSDQEAGAERQKIDAHIGHPARAVLRRHRRQRLVDL